MTRAVQQKAAKPASTTKHTPRGSSAKRNIPQWTEIKGQYDKAKKTFREGQYAVAQACATLAAEFEAGGEGWKEFCEMTFWETRGHRPKVTRRGDCLAFILRYVLGDKKDGNKRANDWKKGIERVLTAGTSPNDVAAGLKASGGFRGKNNKKTEPIGQAKPKRSAAASSGASSTEPTQRARGTVESDPFDNPPKLHADEEGLPFWLAFKASDAARIRGGLFPADVKVTMRVESLSQKVTTGNVIKLKVSKRKTSAA